VIEQTLQSICDLIQEDVGGRGLRTDPNSNLITATAGDFQAASRSIADTENASVAIVTGFYIPTAQPPSGETDGPLGALFLLRTFTLLGIPAVIVTDAFCGQALAAGIDACGLGPAAAIAGAAQKLPGSTNLQVFPRTDGVSAPMSMMGTWHMYKKKKRLTHLIALERVGPSHTLESLECQPGITPEQVNLFAHEAPPERRDRFHTMRGQDITANVYPAHLFFEDAHHSEPQLTTIGIGDGGNEIGMGKIPWDIIRRNIPNGGLVACRVPTDYLIVSGVSNWGAYGLAAGVSLLRGMQLPADLFDVERERELLRIMVEQGPLVDGVSGQPTVSVDGLPFERYAEPLLRIKDCLFISR
jgi:hypothetical protein